jgi:hypothetical protein
MTKSLFLTGMEHHSTSGSSPVYPAIRNSRQVASISVQSPLLKCSLRFHPTHPFCRKSMSTALTRLSTSYSPVRASNQDRITKHSGTRPFYESKSIPLGIFVIINCTCLWCEGFDDLVTLVIKFTDLLNPNPELSFRTLKIISKYQKY